MNDPIIQSYKRPLYEEEVNKFGEMNLDEYRFNFGVYFTNKIDPITPINIPEGIGRIVSRVTQEGDDNDGVIDLTYVNCTDLFSWVNMNQTMKSTKALAGAYCYDPAEALVAGVSTFGNQKRAEMFFQPCKTDSNVSDPDSTCLSNADV